MHTLRLRSRAWSDYRVQLMQAGTGHHPRDTTPVHLRGAR